MHSPSIARRLSEISPAAPRPARLNGGYGMPRRIHKELWPFAAKLVRFSEE